MRFLPFYKLYGLRKASQFLNPVMIQEETFIFPFNSAYFYFKPVSVIENISRDTAMLKRQKDVVVWNVFDYLGEPKGNFRTVNIKEHQIAKDMRANCREFKIPLQEGMKVNIKIKTLEVFNFTTLFKKHVYPSYSLYRIDTFKNSITTLVERLNACQTANKFVYIELPDTVLAYTLFNKLAVEYPIEKIKKITDYRMLTLLELWRYLLKLPNAFDGLRDPENVILLLTSGTRTVPVALGVLSKFIKGDGKGMKEESDLDLDFTYSSLSGTLGIEQSRMEADFSFYRIKPLDSMLLRKMFYILWNNIVTTGTTKKLDENFTDSDDGDVDEEKIDKSDLEKQVSAKLDKVIVEDIPVIADEEFEKENFEITDEEMVNDTNKSISSQLSSGYDDVELDKILSDIDKVRDEVNRRKVVELKQEGVIQSARAKTLLATIDKKANIKVPFKEYEGKTIKDIITESNVDINLKKQEGDITDNKVVFDKSMNKDTVKVFNSTYVKDYLHKDTIKVLAQLESNSFLLDDYTVEKKSNILTDLEEHSVSYKLLNGKNSNVKFYLPTIEEDGTFRMNKNKYKLRLQRTEVPISKLDNLTVLLNSYYGKLFITKANRKSENYGDVILRRINLLPTDAITKLVLENIIVYGVKLPNLYEKIIRNIKSFRYDKIDFTFDYENRFEGVDNEQHLKSLEDRLKGVYIGKSNEAYAYMLFDNSIVLVKGRDVLPYQKLHNVLNISKTEPYSEFVSVKVGNTNVPLYLMFSYYIGIENALKLFKLKYEVVDKKPAITDDQYLIRLADSYIVIDRDYDAGDLVFIGASRDKKLNKITRSSFNTRENFGAIFSFMDFSNALKVEINMLENFFIDPMTKELLRSMKEPTTFIPLLKRATELLVSDERRNPEDIELQTIKGVERVNGMLYRELMNAVKDYEQKSIYGRSTFHFDPYCVMKKIKEDNTTILVNDLNPMSDISQQREVTLLGSGGRDILTITNKDRKYNKTYYGTFTEHYKDNGDTGINAQLTSNPYIENIRGLMSVKDKKIKGAGEVYSMAALLSPLSYMDDGKRLNFCSIMAQHLVPIQGKQPPYLRTGYESVLPISLGEKFISVAEGNGEVTKVTDKEVVVKYSAPLNETKSYRLYSWTSKEESEACYRNELIPNVKVGDKVSKDDTIVYNKSFFVPDMFNRKRVMYARGTYLTVCVADFPETVEDSSVISARVMDTLATRTTKVKSIVLDADKDVPFIVKIGDKVESDSPVMTYLDRGLEDGDLPKATLEILKELKKASPKAKVDGVISKIEVFYNADIKEYSRSVKKLIEESDSRLLEETGFTGRVDHTYSIKGKPMQENQFEIKIYIDVVESMGVGDKGVFGNQLKTVVGDVYNEDIRAEDGRAIDAFFGYTSIQARIVSSTYLMGTTATLLDWVKDLALEAYYGKK